MRVAVSKHDIWRGKDRQIRGCPLSLGLPPLRHTNAKAGENMRKW